MRDAALRQWLLEQHPTAWLARMRLAGVVIIFIEALDGSEDAF
jgi:hypothetical protein